MEVWVDGHFKCVFLEDGLGSRVSLNNFECSWVYFPYFHLMGDIRTSPFIEGISIIITCKNLFLSGW